MAIESKGKVLPSSFRDPDGFIFCHEGFIFRQINHSYKADYDYLMNSGLYSVLTEKGLIIPHKEIDPSSLNNIGFEICVCGQGYKILRPEQVPFVSYPYEWCFSQLQDAALLTLNILKIALDYGMSLKDSSAYNIQFISGRPVFIDTVSFTKYREGRLWGAYRQFCQHFLAPLALMAYSDVRLNQLLKVYIDGIPLDMASKLLPFSTRFNFSLLAHIHAHAKSQRIFSRKELGLKNKRMTRLEFMALIDNLGSAIMNLTWKPTGTEWADYYNETSYTSDAMKEKMGIVSDFIDKIRPKTVWDIGSNIGLFSRIASNKGIFTVSFDIDPSAVEKNYLQVRDKKETKVLPLLLDLVNPSPGIGWENEERMSFMDRGKADLALGLALVHHLAISNNLPFRKIAAFWGRICDHLLIEFVPKDDLQVRRLLTTREDIFPAYTHQSFELEFKKFFEIIDHKNIRESERRLYLMRKLN